MITARPPTVSDFLAAARKHGERGEYGAALSSARSALILSPNNLSGRYFAALALLHLGEWRQAWPLWESRLFDARPRLFPAWDGSPLDGKTILLRFEQGFGDTIMLLRYVPLVIARGGRVHLECPRELAELCRGVEGVEAVYVTGDQVPAGIGAEAWMMSLPGLLDTTTTTIPWDGPYLRADPSRVERFRPMIGEGVKVGLVWTGGTSDPARDVSPDALAPLLSLPVTFYSFQKGREALPGAVDLARQFTDFSDTAAALSLMDAIVTVDTAVAHLAGAMGLRTLLMLHSRAEWRWMPQADSSPWYPSMELFRQDRAGEWAGVVRRVGCRLAEVEQ